MSDSGITPSTAPSSMTSGPPASVVALTAEELAVVRNALRLLRSILGRDEADQLATVESLLERLGRVEG